MTYAYQEIYLSKAQSILGDAFDYAINTCGIVGDDFVKLFVVSAVGCRIEKGDPADLAGKSGIEIVREIVLETAGRELREEPREQFGRSAEYWIGWAIAYYQWFTGRKFHEIFKALSFDDLQRMYAPLHEADISKFVAIADVRIKECFPETNLKHIRTVYGVSQSKLAELSGVSLRAIQMYEQRKKDINKASVSTVYRLAKVLGCTVEDLVEK